MDQKTLFKFGVFAIAGFAATAASAANWTGSTGNWVSDNWGLDAPDGSPGDANYTLHSAEILGSDDVVTVDSVIPNDVVLLRTNGGATLNVATGGSLSVKAGGDFNVRKGTVNVTGGTLNVRHNVEFGRNVGANTAQLNVSAGTFDMSGASGGGRLLRLDGSTGSGVIAVSGTGTFQALNGLAMDHLDLQTFTMTLSDTATFDLVGASNNSTWDMAGNTGVTGLSHTFSLVGSNVTAEAGGINAFATDAGHSATFEFTADGSGFSTFTVGTLTLTGGDHAADLIVDLNGLTSGNYDLFSYTSLVGTAFNSVTYLNGSATLDYGTGTSDTISLSIVPEPGTYALIAGLAGLSVVMLRRRKA